MREPCELCGRTIPAARLKALPGTKRCVRCAEEQGSDLTYRRVEVGMDLDTYKDLLRATRT